MIAFGEWVLFTWHLILCQRLGRKGVGPSVVFGRRFPLYALTALDRCVIFLLQIAEGRVSYSTPTLLGLGIYCAGAILADTGAVRAATSS